MAGKTFAIHTTQENIDRVDRHAEKMRRSRNSLINEAIEMLLETLDAERRKTQDAKFKKAGAR